MACPAEDAGNGHCGNSRSPGEHDEAHELVRKAVEMEGDIPEIWLHYGTVLQQRGEIEAACDAWRRAVDLEPGNYEALRELSLELVRLGRFEEARELLERSFAAAPYVEIRDLAGEAFSRQGRRLVEEGEEG